MCDDDDDNTGNEFRYIIVIITVTSITRNSKNKNHLSTTTIIDMETTFIIMNKVMAHMITIKARKLKNLYVSNDNGCKNNGSNNKDDNGKINPF